MITSGLMRPHIAASEAASVTSTSSWLNATCSTPAAIAARTISLPSCPVAPRIATGLEDDIALHHVLQRGVPLDQALVPFDGARGRAVGERPLAQRSEDLARAGLR